MQYYLCLSEGKLNKIKLLHSSDFKQENVYLTWGYSNYLARLMIIGLCLNFDCLQTLQIGL